MLSKGQFFPLFKRNASENETCPAHGNAKKKISSSNNKVIQKVPIVTKRGGTG
jgi:hypothetical protein